MKICYVIEKEDDYDSKNDEKEQEIECDYLFLACGVKKSLSFLTDATDQEKEIFSALSPHTFCATVWEGDTHHDDKDETVVEVWPNIIWKGNAHLFAMRNSIKCLLNHDKYNKYVKQGKITKDRQVGYQFMRREPKENKKEDEQFFSEILTKDLEIWGEKNVKIVNQKVWDYFPIWDQGSINKGYPWIVKDEMQG
eukprot:302824_1